MTSATPQTQRAILIRSKGVAEVANDAPVPQLRADYILVKTVAVALNPTDWKHIHHAYTVNALVGCDYAGIVEDVGENLTRAFKKGDRVAGLAHGANSVQLQDGAFAEYIVAKSGLALKIPESVSFEDAATLGVGITTVGQGVFQSLGLPLPGSGGASDTLFVYGGSTATGTLAIQFAKLAGWKVVTTCSPRNFDLVKKHGADKAFDYNDPESAKKILEYTNGELRFAFDTISNKASAEFCAVAIGPKGGKYSNLLPNADIPRSDVANLSTLAYSATGERSVKFGSELPAVKEDYEFATKFWKLTEDLLAQGKLKVHPPTVGKDGLKGVLNGLELLRTDKVSGEKLVYRVAETPK